jgi:hypothetical protein
VSQSDIQKIREQDHSVRAEWATRIWNDADTISRVESDLALRTRTHFGGKRISRSPNHFFLIKQKEAAIAYLSSRGMLEFARQSGCRIKISNRSGDSTPWSLIWPIHRVERTASGNRTPRVAISRESGRGHAAKRMLGPAKGGFMPTPPLIPTSRIVVFAEGTATTCAVRRMTGGASITTFTAGALAKIDRDMIVMLAANFDEFWIAADNDPLAPLMKRHPGQHAANQAAIAILETLGSDHKRGKRVMIATPPDEGDDWADVADRLGDTEAADLFHRSLSPPVLPALGTHDRDRSRYLPSTALARTAWYGVGQSNRSIAPDPVAVKAAASLLATELERALATLADRSAQPLPSLVIATTGLGKTATMADLIGRSPPESPLLISTPRIDDRDALAAAISAASGGTLRPHVHHGRNEQTCTVFRESVKTLQDAARSPSPWVCSSCEHGQEDSPTPCGYMAGLRSSMAARVVVTTHAAIGEDSALLDFRESGTKIRRRLIIDESIVRHKIIHITTEMIAAACMQRTQACQRLEQLRLSAELSRQDLRAAGEHDLVKKIDAEIVALTDGLTWIGRTIRVLERMATALGASVGKPRMSLGGEEWADLAEIGRSMPKWAFLHDGTVIESVQVARRQNLPIPPSWITTLAKAVAAGTAWMVDGVVVAGHATGLYTRWLDEGGLLLDATPNARVCHDVTRRGGTIYKVTAPEPIKFVQVGPRVHGRGRLGTPTIRARLAAELIELMDDAIADGKTVAAITHKPVGQLIARSRTDLAEWVGWWGRDEKAHNRWSGVDLLILFGLPIPAPSVSYHEYALDQAAMGGSEWDGATERDVLVDLDEGRWIRSSVPLPVEPTARAWLIDKWTADVSQAAGRLRACRADHTVECRIYGGVPLCGHGIVVDDFTTEHGATRARAAIRYAIAGAIQDGDSHRRPSRAATRARLAELGLTPSNATIDKIAREISVAALHSGRTIDEELSTVVRYYEVMLSGEDSGHDLVGAAFLAAWRCGDKAEAARWRATATLIADRLAGVAPDDTVEAAPVWPCAPPSQRERIT